MVETTENKNEETAQNFPCPVSPTGQHEFRESEQLSSPAVIYYYCVYCLGRHAWDRVAEEIEQQKEKLLTSKK